MQVETEENVRNLIIAAIEDHGYISVDEYTSITIAHYYSSRMPLMKEGGFKTAPEITTLFGEMIAVWLVDAWTQLGKPDDFNLVEMGPGKGTLMLEILEASKDHEEFSKAANICMIENSEVFTLEQQSTLSKYSNVEWYMNFSDIDEKFTLVVANEFFDSLPVKQYEMQEGKWSERVIKYNEKDDAFFIDYIPCDISEDAESGAVFELSNAGLAIAKDISSFISEYGGAGLFIDYGYDEPMLKDTIQAVRERKYVNLLECYGDCDITAYVNFNALKYVMKDNVDILGVIPQGEFLSSLGIEIRASMLVSHADDDNNIMQDLKRITDSSEMGHIFKVLGFAKIDNEEVSLAGF